VRPTAWTAFGDVTPVGDPQRGLSVRAPENDYAQLRGVWVDARFCNATIDLDARLDAPTQDSPGFGFAVGLRATVRDGLPYGWSLQLEWDPALPGFAHRPAMLPDEARTGGNSRPGGPMPGSWHHLRLQVRGTTVTVAMDGTELGGSPYTVDAAACGDLLLRVWGTTVQFRDVAIRPL